MTTTKPATSRRSRFLAVGIAAATLAAAWLLFAGSGSDTTIDNPAAAAAPTGPPAPDTEFVFFDGATATLAAYEGRPLVVNFWASWCPSCVAEMSAAFLPVQDALGDGVAFLGMNLQDERGRALELVEETGVLFDLAEDPRGDLYTALGGLGMPFTVFIGPDGSVLHTHNGPVTAGQLTDLIAEFLQS